MIPPSVSPYCMAIPFRWFVPPSVRASERLMLGTRLARCFDASRVSVQVCFFSRSEALRAESRGTEGEAEGDKGTRWLAATNVPAKLLRSVSQASSLWCLCFPSASSVYVSPQDESKEARKRQGRSSTKLVSPASALQHDQKQLLQKTKATTTGTRDDGQRAPRALVVHRRIATTIDDSYFVRRDFLPIVVHFLILVITAYFLGDSR